MFFWVDGQKLHLGEFFAQQSTVLSSYFKVFHRSLVDLPFGTLFAYEGVEHFKIIRKDIEMSKIQANANNQVKRHQESRSASAARIASGKQINKASQGAAELAASSKLNATSRSLSAATSNARRALTLGQTADGGLSQAQDEVVRIKELAVQASSDTFDDSDRAKASAEVAARLSTIDDVIVKTTRFGDTTLLDGTGGEASDGVFQFQVAEKAGDISTLDLSAKFDTATLGIDAAAVDTITNAQTAIGLCDTAIGLINDGRSATGAFMAGMESTINVNDVKQENVDNAVSVFSDADIAKEATALSKAEIGEQLAQAMISGANNAEKNIPGLLR